MIFSEKIKINPSATLAINALVQQKKMKGEKVFNLSVGEPMINTDPVIIKAANESLARGETHYPPVQGLKKLLALSTDWINESFGSTYTEEEVVVTSGGKFGIYLTLQSLLNDCDEVLISSPYWVSYPEMVKLFGGVPVIIKTDADKGWKMSVSSLQRAVTDKTKILILNNASNPAGTLYNHEELSAILEFARKNNILVLSDEVYSGLVYDDNVFISCASFEKFKENVIIIQSCSKNFAMTGWRIGFVFGPKELIKKITMLQGQSTSGVSTMCQWAAVAALENRERIMLDIKKEIERRRDVFVASFNSLFDCKIKAPTSSLYAFIPVRYFNSSKKSSYFSKELLEKANIASVPGESFGEDDYVRFSFGVSENDIKEGLTALKNYLLPS